MMTLPHYLFLAARLDWGFGNPNKTGALIATLIVAVWILPCWHRRLFWLALLLCTVLGSCLMQTASRGGIVAAAVGLGILLGCLPRPWPRRKMLGTVVSVWVILCIAVWLPTMHRFGKAMGGQDLSVTQRLELWRAAPRMMVDAPSGWGFGHAANAYQQWYQPLEQTQTYLTLINSHLTWLVEIGWPRRFLYVFGWLAVLALCWPKELRGQSFDWLIIPFAVWVVFAVAAWFSSVADSPWLWVVPAISLVSTLVWRGGTGTWPPLRNWTILVLSTCLVLGTCIVLGSLPDGNPRIRLAGSRIMLGNHPSHPDVWVITNPDVFGKLYGRTLRQFWQTSADPRRGSGLTVALVQSVDQLTPTGIRAKTLVAGGTMTASELDQIKKLVPPCGKLILLNPAFYPRALEVASSPSAKIEVVSGEFSQVPSTAWADALKQPVHNVPGAGDFLPRWPELVLNNH